jgi:hypothetical protein
VRRLGLLGLLVILMAAGCANSRDTSDANNRDTSDNDKRGGFYGGISGGGTWP